jgi:hypothetical protein
MITSHSRCKTKTEASFLSTHQEEPERHPINIALAKLRSEGKIALAVASGGIAAQPLANGRTAHSTFNIPLNLMATETPMCKIKRGSATATLLHRCSAIFWNEATMTNKLASEDLDRTLQDIKIVLIFSEEFCSFFRVIFAKHSRLLEEVDGRTKLKPALRIGTFGKVSKHTLSQLTCEYIYIQRYKCW